MSRGSHRALLPLFLLVAIVGLTTVTFHGQGGALKTGEWRTYGGDLGHTRYSPLDQINADNFSKLEVAWRFKTDNLGPLPEFNLQSTPLMVNGVLYSTGGTRRAVVALDARTGEQLWMHSLNEGKRAEVSPRRLSGRGLSYWSDGKEERILYVTLGYQLVALDAKSGRPVPGFGKNGIVDLKLDNDQAVDPVTGEFGLHAVPVVAGDTVIVGAAHLPGGSPRSKTNVKGYIRAFDVRTGKRLWIFHTIPMPGEFGNDTWLNDSWAYTGNTGVWANMAVDEQLGLVYLPVELPTGDWYGGNRPGNGLFGESLVAVDLKTGQRRWHYQMIHHGIWDYDNPAPSILIDITVNGKPIKAIAHPTKQAFMYVFDRATGQPVWPIEERPVPKGDVPGEWYSPTQPFPTKPPAFDRQGFSIDDLIDFTPELRAEAIKLVSRYKIGPIYTPPVVSKWEGPLALLMLPSAGGGVNWYGGSADPETGMVYVGSVTTPTAVGLVPADPAKSDFGYASGRAQNPDTPAPAGGRGSGAAPATAAAGTGRGAPGTSPPGALTPQVVGGVGDVPAPQAEGAPAGGPLNIQGLPLVKPPWGRITAYDMNKGEIAWQIAHGETPDNVRNHPALKGLNIPRTGRQGRLGTLVTKTLLIAGEGGFFTTPSGQRGAMLRAYNKANGQEVGAVYMPAPQTGSPMTYMLDGRQYIVVSISGGTYSGELLALRLPAEK
jgi:quinoprotein glucose dehydrogenase